MSCAQNRYFVIICTEASKSFAPEGLCKIFSTNQQGKYIFETNDKAIKTLPNAINNDMEQFKQWLIETIPTVTKANITTLTEKGVDVSVSKQDLKIRLNECQLLDLYESWLQGKKHFLTDPKSLVKESFGPETMAFEDPKFEDLDAFVQQNILAMLGTDIETAKAFCSASKNLKQICDSITFTVTDLAGNEETIKGVLNYLKYQQDKTQKIQNTIAEIMEGRPSMRDYAMTVYTNLDHINIVNPFFGTILMEALENNQEDCVRELLSWGADPNIPVFSGHTHLTNAIAGNLELTKLLVEAGANIDGKTRLKEFTPLMAAVLMRRPEIVDYLLKKGADVDAQDKQGKTALMHAQEKGFGEIVQILEAAGAEE